MSPSPSPLLLLLTREGYLVEEQGMTYLAATSPEAAPGPLQSAACTYRIAFGPRAGQKVLSFQTVPTQAPSPPPVRCVSEQGFSLHAEVRCAIHQRHELEHLCRSIGGIKGPIDGTSSYRKLDRRPPCRPLASPETEGPTGVVAHP